MKMLGIGKALRVEPSRSYKPSEAAFAVQGRTQQRRGRGRHRIVSSEIAEWRLADGTFQDESELLKMKLERKQVTDLYWKGSRTTEIFQCGFGFLGKDQAWKERMPFDPE